MISAKITSGYLAYRILDDGRLAGVLPTMFGRAKIVVTDDDLGYSYGDSWCYDSPVLAISALHAWIPETQPEPEHWMRHPASGRRRPGGDPSKEYVHQ